MYDESWTRALHPGPARAMFDALRPRLTPGFLTTLRLAVRTCGGDVDMAQSEAFVAWCHALADAAYTPTYRPLILDANRDDK